MMDNGVLAYGAASVLSGYMVLLLASSVYAKLSDFQKFKMIIGGYRMVPGFFIPGVACVVIVSELILSILLIIPPTQFLGLTGTSFLLLTYALIAAIAIWRGDAGVPCGCGPDDQTVSWILVLKNSALANVSMWTANSLTAENRDIIPMILFTVLGFSVFIMERTVAQLKKNHSKGLARTRKRTIQ